MPYSYDEMFRTSSTTPFVSTLLFFYPFLFILILLISLYNLNHCKDGVEPQF